MGMTLVVVEPTDVILFYVICPHCGQGFGKGDGPELVYESADQKTAIHKRCVEELAVMPTPEEVRKRRERARRSLLSDRRALVVKSRRGAAG